MADNFSQALENCKAAQEKLLFEILRKNSSSSIGLKHDFNSLSSYSKFASSLPIRTYGDFQDEIYRTLHGECFLCSEKINFAEVTGGSTGGGKLIPYNDSLINSYQKALYPWFLNLLNHWDSVTGGRMYWAISPAFRESMQIKITVPLGPSNDAIYFGEKCVPHLNQLIVGIEDSDSSDNLNQWRYNTLAALLLCDDLSFISVWSPTFLLELLRFLCEHKSEVLLQVRKRDARRADIVRSGISDDSIDIEEIWPRLSLISCWVDAGAKRFVPSLQKIFSGIDIQGKGLFATEGIVTIPWEEASGAVIAADSTFVEFVSTDGKIRVCDELSIGETYRVLITTFGGLYRYDLGDYVRVNGYYKSSPVLEFVGRGDLVSDLCGEKLEEAFVAQCLLDVPGFAMLAPLDYPHPHYMLIVDESVVRESEISGVAEAVEVRLQENPQYKYAQAMNQLRQLKCIPVSSPLMRLEKLREKGKQKIGVLKPLALSNDTTWIERFTA